MNTCILLSYLHSWLVILLTVQLVHKFSLHKQSIFSVLAWALCCPSVASQVASYNGI